MKVIYSPNYNINAGVFGRFHPFDGMKYAKVVEEIRSLPGLLVQAPEGAVDKRQVEEFVGEILMRLLSSKRYILRALELPYIPLLPFSLIERRVLDPMRWAVSGTIMAAREALGGANVWNLSGGYHHASRHAAEGFCVFNDIGIAVQHLIGERLLSPADRILIVDVDAHHGNGNAYVFMEDHRVEILDIYNNSIHPQNAFTKARVDINIPLTSRTGGDEYLSRLRSGLDEIREGYALAFVVAGTDVLSSDPLGGLDLSLQDCAHRDEMVLAKLAEIGTPAVFLGGGGYGRDSARAMANSIAALYDR